MEFIDLKSQYHLLENNIKSRIHKVLDHGQYIMGPEVFELEERLAAYVGVKHCIGLSSGTDALLVALMALGVKAGDEVITTDFSFFATAEVICLLGAIPVVVDIKSDTYNIDPTLIEKAITAKTKAIIPVSLYGQCADFNEINAIAAKHNIPVIEDGAQSFGASYHGKQSCGLSTIGCTSFFPSKPLGGYGDSGACFTNDDALAKTMREIRVHGQSQRYTHTSIGINARIDTMQAAILLAKMDVFADEVVKRQERANYYSQHLPKSLTPPTILSHNSSVYAQYTIQVDDREVVAQRLKEQGIPTAVHYPKPLSTQPALASMQHRFETPISHRAAQRVMSLPFSPYISQGDQRKVIDAVLEFAEVVVSL